jgi:hypothetical protein
MGRGKTLKDLVWRYGLQVLVNEGGDKMISQRDLDSNAKQITVRVNAYEGGIIELFLNLRIAW